MKKLFAIISAVFMMLSCSVVCFAAESAEVFAKYEGESKRTEIPVSGDSVSATLPDDIQLTVENIPNDAVMLVVYSIPSSETEAWNWINACFEDTATPVHAFDIYFADANGNRTNADGAAVTIQCSHCKNAPAVYSLTTSENVTELNSSNGIFSTDGSHYYVMAEKASAPDVDDDHKADVKDPTGDEGDKSTVTDKDGNETEDNGDDGYSHDRSDSDVNYNDKANNAPQTGDNSNMLWIALVLLGCSTLVSTAVYSKKRKRSIK